MTRFQEFLAVLHPPELSTLASLSLQGKEEQVMKYYIKHRHDDLDRESLEKQLQVTSLHLNKILAVLLRKSYSRLGGDGLSLLKFLATKPTLIGHYKKEISRCEKWFLSKRDTEEPEKFYSECLITLSTASAKYIDVAYISRIAKKYLSSIPRSRIDEERIYVKSIIIRSTVWKRSAMPVYVRKYEREKVLAELTKLESQAKKISSNYAMFFVLLSKADVYFFAEDPQHVDYLGRALTLARKLGKRLPQVYQTRIITKHAEALYITKSDFVGAFKEYNHFFEFYGERARTDVYHCSKYIQIALITGNYEAAWETLERAFAIYSNLKSETTSVMAALNYAKYYLITGNLEKAFTFIKRGQKLIAKKMYIQYEIEFRNLENTYFFLKGEYLLSRDLADKNSKYLRSKGFLLAESDFPEFFAMIKELVDFKVEKKPLTSEFSARYTNWQTGVYNVYGTLLGLMKNK